MTTKTWKTYEIKCQSCKTGTVPAVLHEAGRRVCGDCARSSK